ncbi:hypothetical protein F511_44436 [Dorcoceras hygrometricum]|uniref:Uncharacterized protein n=1 Tax=Dorcoceras hygrometricum TaxID=472368 RepID=A0A2Z7C9N2_9LAMI|nr:hypothetical protein F511_44436 [Dorcoceras hygrometricum]
MGKTLLRALQECTEEGASRQAAPEVAKKRKVLPPPRRRPGARIRRRPTLPKRSPLVQPRSAGRRRLQARRGTTTERDPGRAPVLNLFEDSLVVSPSGVVATGLLCNMIPDRDIARLRSTTNSETVGLFVTQFTVAMAWGDEVIKRLTQAQREANSARQSFDEVMEHHIELEMQLADLEAVRTVWLNFDPTATPREEHPAPFLSMTRALDELSDDDEEEAEEGDEEEDKEGDEEEDEEGATPPNPLSNSCT